MVSTVSADLATGRRLRDRNLIAREALTALFKAWTAYALKRAIADVASMGDQDYRTLGLAKAEMLRALEQLRDELQRDAGLAAADARRNRMRYRCDQAQAWSTCRP